MRFSNSITDVPGILVGHADDPIALTGCTVIICEKGAVAGVDQRGGAPGTRETDALRPMHLVQNIHAVLLSGGSAFGLDAAAGVMVHLEKKGIGVDTGVARVPIVGAAVIFDLAVGNPSIRPTPEMAALACANASANPPATGNVGVGMGATVGKALGMQYCMKGGVGSASVHLNGGVVVGAIMAVNPYGDVIDPQTRTIIAGTRTMEKGPLRIGRGGYFADTMSVMETIAEKNPLRLFSTHNTVIGVVATNAKLSKNEASKIAQMAQNGIAMAIRPAHTMFDGDTIFCMSTGSKKTDVNLIGACAAEVVARAIVDAVRSAHSLPGIPAFDDVSNGDLQPHE